MYNPTGHSSDVHAVSPMLRYDIVEYPIEFADVAADDNHDHDHDDHAADDGDDGENTDADSRCAGGLATAPMRHW